MSAFTYGGELIHYEFLGRGRPVILLHTWVGSWRYWRPTMEALASKYKVYALDFFGFGDSSKNPTKFSVEHQIALVDEFMTKNGIQKAAVFGHGLGALVAVSFARRYPDRVPRLLLTGAPLFDPGDLDRRVPVSRDTLTRYSDVDDGGDVTPDSMTVPSASAAMRAALLAAARANADQIAPDLRAMLSTETPADYNPLLPVLRDLLPDGLITRCFRRDDVMFEVLIGDLPKTHTRAPLASVEGFDAGRMLDMLRLLKMPTLIVQGAGDPLLPTVTEPTLHYITYDKEHQLLPVILPNVRHFPMIEHDRFHWLAGEFLEAADVSRLEFKERWRRRTR